MVVIALVVFVSQFSLSCKELKPVLLLEVNLLPNHIYKIYTNQWSGVTNIHRTILTHEHGHYLSFLETKAISLLLTALL